MRLSRNFLELGRDFARGFLVGFVAVGLAVAVLAVVVGL